MERIVFQRRQASAARETLEKAELIIDPMTGVVRDIYEVPLYPDDPPIFYYLTRLADTSRLSAFKCIQIGSGVSLIRRRSMASAIGEAIERYSPVMHYQCESKNFLEASFDEIDAPAINPRDFPLCSRKEYVQSEGSTMCLSEFSEEVRMNWIRGYSLISDSQIFVPACFVYLPYHFKMKEEFIWFPSSTGLACGNNIEESVLRGIMEVVERDAFSIMWLNRLQMPLVDLSGLMNVELREIVARIKAIDLEIYANNITTDVGIPTFCAWIIDRSGRGPAVSVGASANLNSETAIRKALEEAVHCRMWVKSIMHSSQESSFAEDFSDVVRFEDHVLLYSRVEMLPHLDFILNSPKKVTGSDIDDLSSGDLMMDITKSVSLLSKRVEEVIAIDVTSTDIAEVGFRVVRIIIPGMQPLSQDHRFRFLGGSRVYEVPRHLGYSERDTKEEEINPYPHPFP